jgi:hypothetical protein
MVSDSYHTVVLGSSTSNPSESLLSQAKDTVASQNHLKWSSERHISCQHWEYGYGYRILPSGVCRMGASKI